MKLAFTDGARPRVVGVGVAVGSSPATISPRRRSSPNGRSLAGPGAGAATCLDGGLTFSPPEGGVSRPSRPATAVSTPSRGGHAGGGRPSSGRPGLAAVSVGVGAGGVTPACGLTCVSTCASRGRTPLPAERSTPARTGGVATRGAPSARVAATAISAERPRTRLAGRPVSGRGPGGVTASRGTTGTRRGRIGSSVRTSGRRLGEVVTTAPCAGSCTGPTTGPCVSLTCVTVSLV